MDSNAFVANGVETQIPCLTCMSMAVIRHGHVERSHAPAHEIDCPKCGSTITLVGYHCPDCISDELVRELRNKIRQLEHSRQFHKLRTVALKELAKRLPEPYKTWAYDIIANGQAGYWRTAEGEGQQ